MRQPIFERSFWKSRVQEAIASDELRHSVYCCSGDEWNAVNARHRAILRGYINPTQSILDAGCGYGRLLNLLPKEWRGQYLGLDLSPDLLAIAKAAHPDKTFMVADLRDLKGVVPTVYDWAVLISIRDMVIDNVGAEAWKAMVASLKSVAHRLLILEYNTADKGDVL